MDKIIADCRLRIADLKNQRIGTIVSALRRNQEMHLKNLPAGEIISMLDHVASRWLNLKDPIRRQAERLLSQSTGCSIPVIQKGLDLAFQEVRASKLKMALQTLEKFSRPRLSLFIFAGIIPTPMLFDVFLGFLLRSAIITKSPSREPFFLPLLQQSIQKVDSKLGQCLETLWWPGGSDDLEKAMFRRADLIHSYGDDETIEKIRAKIPPHKLFLAFGHKVSLCIIGKEALTEDPVKYAKRAALDIALYDQQGCLSPHVIYVESDDLKRVEGWAKKLAHAMENISTHLPPGHLSLDEASQIHQFRSRHAVQKTTRCFFDPVSLGWTVIYDPNTEFTPSCLNRVIFVKPIRKLEHLSNSLKKWKGSFQALGYAPSSFRQEKWVRIENNLRIPILAPIGRLQALSFQAHIEERLIKLRATSKVKAKDNWR